MRRDADLGELEHQELADAVVDDALADDRAALLIVETAGIVLEMLHEGAGFRALEQHLAFALVNLAAPQHVRSVQSWNAA